MKWLRAIALVLLSVFVIIGYLGLGGASWWIYPTSSLEQDILLEIRAPRLVLALLNGMILGGAGAVFQIILRNPLAEPGITGVSTGTALTIVVALYFGWQGPVAWALPFVGMLGGLASLALLWLLAGRGANPLRLILAGVALAALAGAGISLVLNLAPNPFAFQEWSLWLMGSLANRGWEHVELLAPITLLGLVLITTQRSFINAHIFDFSTFQQFGFNVSVRSLLLLLGLTLWISGSVVSAGAISFIGLLAPHLVRLLGIYHPQKLIALSMVMGAVILVAVDAMVLLIPTRVELQLGVIAAALGAPMLLHLLARQRLISDA